MTVEATPKLSHAIAKASGSSPALVFIATIARACGIGRLAVDGAVGGVKINAGNGNVVSVGHQTPAGFNASAAAVACACKDLVVAWTPVSSRLDRLRDEARREPAGARG